MHGIITINRLNQNNTRAAEIIARHAAENNRQLTPAQQEFVTKHSASRDTNQPEDSKSST